MCAICIKDLMYFFSVSEANILARHGTNRQPNKLREPNGTSLFGNERQDRDSLLDNRAFVFALLLILASTHDTAADARLIVA